MILLRDHPLRCVSLNIQLKCMHAGTDRISHRIISRQQKALDLVKWKKPSSIKTMALQGLQCKANFYRSSSPANFGNGFDTIF